MANLCELNKIEYVIAVPHNIIGPRQKYDDPFRNVVSIMINRMMQGKAPIIYGDGEQTRSFSDVDDCIYCLDKLATDKNINKQTFNIGPDEENVTINELYKIISNKLQYNEPAIHTKDRPNEVKHAVCSADKARKYLGYQTTVKLDDSIQKVINYIKSKGTKKFTYNYKLEINNEKTPDTWKKKVF